MSILGIRDSSFLINQRRMHFNILAENQTSDTLLQVAKKINLAVEKFESRNFYAIHIDKYKSLITFIVSKYFNLLKGIYKLKGIVGFIFAIILIIPNIANLTNILSISTLNSLSNIFFSLIVAFISVGDIKKSYIEYRRTKELKNNINCINTNNNGKNYEHLVKKTLKKIRRKSPKINFHPMSYLMYYEYYIKQGEK